MVMAMACVRAWGFMTTENMRLFGVCAIGLIGVLLVYAIPVQKAVFIRLYCLAPAMRCASCP